VFVFLVLAAQYESGRCRSPSSSRAMCILARSPVWDLRAATINIFTAGFVVLVGLASKNAILIVEVRQAQHEEGGLPAP